MPSLRLLATENAVSLPKRGQSHGPPEKTDNRSGTAEDRTRSDTSCDHGSCLQKPPVVTRSANAPLYRVREYVRVSELMRIVSPGSL
jgi:hypothetical protein